MKYFHPKHNKMDEQGNVLFYILIAIVLLAALSFVVANSTRGGGKGVSEDKARLLATEIIEYSHDMQSAVAQLRLRGVDDDQLCFDHSSWGGSNYNHGGCTDSYNQIYSPGEGGLNWKNAPSEAMNSAASPDNLWHIYGDNEIEGIGTTNGDATSTDLVLFVDELSLSVCQQINGLLDITAADATPPTDTDIGETRYAGAFTYTATIGDEVGGAALDGQPAGCFQNTTDSKYTYYKVLIAR